MNIEVIHVTMHDNDYRTFIAYALEDMWNKWSGGYLGKDSIALFNKKNEENPEYFRNYILQNIYGQLQKRLRRDGIFKPYTIEEIGIDYVIENLKIDFESSSLLDAKSQYEYGVNFDGNGEHCFLDFYNGNVTIV